MLSKINNYLISLVIFGLFVGGLVFCYPLYSRPTVSVIMSTYNRQNLLPKAVDSILKQSFVDFEFIIIDDGSSDKTADILKEYAKKDKRIKLITHEQNKGLIFSLNEGLNLARGKYIARMDDDDESFLLRLENQINFLKNHPDIVGVGSWVSPPESIEPYSFQKETNPERIKILLLLGENSVSHPAFVVKKEFLEKHHIRYRQEYKSAEDRPFYADIMFAGGKLTNVPEVLLHYRLHMNNSEDYYFSQQQNIFRFQKDYLKKYFGLEITKKIPKCVALHFLIEGNKKVGLLDVDELNKINKEDCSELSILTFSHPYWTDTIFITGENELVRGENLDKGKIVKRTKKSIVVRWDSWGTETFKLDGENHYILIQ